MEMDERKTKILQAIIRNYLETGEPVGSRTISKDTDLPAAIQLDFLVVFLYILQKDLEL